MPRRGPSQARRSEDGETRVREARDWFALSDSSPEGVATWDIKREQLADAVLAVLGTGSAIMFGVTRDVSAVSVTIFDGERKNRVFCGDSLDLDEAMATLLRVALGRGAGQGS